MGYHSFPVGAWRSLVAHLHGVQGVASSNLVAPTNLTKNYPAGVVRFALSAALLRTEHGSQKPVLMYIGAGSGIDL